MRLLVCAGEASGDRLGALVVERLDVDAFGLVGPALRAAGARPVRDMADATAFGLAEVVTSLPRIAGVYGDIVRAIDDADVVLTIDSPDLMLRIARAAKGRGVPAIHLVSPQVWAWRPGRAAKVAASVDQLLCLLPFEPALYPPGTATFVGHPALDGIVGPGRDDVTFALVPGSRAGEIRSMWPVFREVARQVRRRLPEARFAVALAPTVSRTDLGGLDCTYVDGLEGLPACRAALVTSGTASLQVAAMGIPQVVAYRVSRATWPIAKRLVRVEHIALPNLVLGEGRVVEHVQHLDAGVICADLLAADTDLSEALRPLGDGAVQRTVDVVARWLR